MTFKKKEYVAKTNLDLQLVVGWFKKHDDKLLQPIIFKTW